MNTGRTNAGPNARGSWINTNTMREGSRGYPHLPPKPRRKSRQLPTEWPKVGGRDLDLTHTAAFLSPEYRDVYRPGETRLIYLGACTGLAALSHNFHLPAYKASTTSEDGAERRMFELRRDEAGAYYFCNGDYVHQSGWDCWFPSHLYPVRGPSPNSPVESRQRALVVHLPDDCSATRFDALFDREVRKGALDLWAMTPEARNHCAFLGQDQNLLQRFTRYPDWTLMPMQELVGISIFGGVDRLIRIAENVILEHLAIRSSSEA